MINKTLNLWLVPIFLAAVLRGAPVGPVSLSLLDKLATDIVVGSVVAPSSGTLTVDIRRAIKGGLVAGTLVSLSVPAPVSGSVQAKPSSDQPVIVFLQKNGSTYELLPSSLTVFLPGQGLFYPAHLTFSETGLSSQSTSFDRLVAEFGAGLLDSRDVPDEYLMFLPGILWQADGPSVDKLGEALAASSNPSHRAGGFLIQIQRGNLAALTRYRNDKGLKPSQIGVLDLTSALNWRDPNPEAIKVLGELSREPAGKTAPLALQTLRRLRSKETLPYFALALENSDADVQYQGMAGLAEFANGFWQKPGPEGAARTGVPGRVTEFTSSDTLSPIFRPLTHLERVEKDM